MPFVALETSLALIAELRVTLAALSLRDAPLADQLRRAASSVPLNLGEGRRRTGRDRLHHWKVAAGSAEEVRAALRAAVAWGYVKDADVKRPLELCDELAAMLWRMTR